MTRRLSPRSAAAAAAAPALSEREFQAQVIDLARVLGWRSAHFRPAYTARGWRTPVQGDGAGFPDTVLVRGDRILFAELKAAAGKVSDEQRAWIDALKAAGAETYVWRPADFDLIVGVLQSKRRPLAAALSGAA